MYFLVVTEDIWGKKSFSTQEYDCDPDDPECGAAEKATPFNQIVFQSIVMHLSIPSFTFHPILIFFP